MADTADVQDEQCKSMPSIFGEEGPRSNYRWDCFFKKICPQSDVSMDRQGQEAETRRRSA